MAAGDSAAEQSRLASERVARLKRQLDLAERATKSWDTSAVGERVVADRLSQLIPHGWYVLHDVHWPGRPKAILDHVLVGPGGIVVVDAKNWTGEVRVSSGVLWQGRYSRTQSVEGALAQCAAVASVLSPPHRRLVRPLICMAAQPDLFGITSSDVAVAGVDRVVAAVTALPAVLDQQTVVGLYAHLGQMLTQDQEDSALLGMRAPAETPSGTAASAPSPAGSPQADTGQAASGPAGRGQQAAKGLKGRPQVAKSAGHRPAVPRQGSRGTVAGTGGRKSRAHDHAAGSMARLVLLGAFVIFAVYILPYWGR
ncbi:nuclease-related domain-containing protein [Arthrobacter sp. S39]|uniref:nuclease-related domain-containing protein n=1 Tax=Arthrobacter sp. S39 TaxID=2509720 RepID=UPI001037B262|nr:nuclease-related domain-containing protein [Arthrobacter sp. S39]TAP45021.1 NERD domain-containing protein [Arthrobacter sp. S39]